MSFLRLSALLSAMRAKAAAVPDVGDPRLRAAALAMAHFGAELTATQPACVNVAALCLAMPRLRVHELRAPVPEVVAETDLHALPGEPPALLLRGPVLLEVDDPEHETLVGALPFHGGGWQRTVCLGAYEFDGTWYLVGLGHPDGVIVSRWRPRWGEADVSAGVVPRAEGDLLVGEVEGYDEWGRDAARALVVLGLLLDAVESPLRVADEGPRLAGRSKSGPSRRPASLLLAAALGLRLGSGARLLLALAAATSSAATSTSSATSATSATTSAVASAAVLRAHVYRHL